MYTDNGYQFSLQEISHIVNGNDKKNIIELLNQKISIINKQIQDQQFLVREMQDEINGGDIMTSNRDFEIKINEQKRLQVVSIRKTISMEDIGSLIGKVFETIFHNGLEPADEVMSIIFCHKYCLCSISIS